ncbi:MAG: HAD family phosphatase [Methanosarcinaceae archaeon]|nr:HAD family phosphatase [Methanosarcinaceae archaeon]MDD4497044.1 HAD family phosphatase [Methanosarcinaceae archaeon]
MFKAIIFDVDGVLVDSMRFHADAWVEAFGEVGLSIRREDIYEIEGANDRGVIELIFRKKGWENPDSNHFEALHLRKRELLIFENIKPYKGIIECLHHLKKKYRLALVSGSDRPLVEKMLTNYFPDIFELGVAGADVEHGKPAPDPYLKAVEMLDLKKEECLVVENAPIGIEAAKRAGLYCVAVQSTLGAEKLDRADLVFKGHAELFEYFENLLSNFKQVP